MKFGFVIDNRKCIGCHACTTACKSEHQTPVGVNRTWVKQVEKGTFPNTRRLFSVMRCNHCTDAPCVDICPVEALYYREDGIVDFDNRRCIGCKSCMQACPYDALYIDPASNTAAKCNYCAHRIDIGLEPACVNVCPEHAIISGDMDDPNSEITTLLSRQQVKVRKAEKGTSPNLFYIDGDDASLNPSLTETSDTYFWSSQATGVGHYAKEAEKLSFSNGDVVSAVLETSGNQVRNDEREEKGNAKSIDILMGKARRIYDAPNKGILWGWEVSGYVLTKAISAGTFIVLFLAWLSGNLPSGQSWMATGIITAMVFLLLTGVLLVMDLDRPDRFLNVLLRPQWNSWLVRGGYAISLFGGLMTVLLILPFLKLAPLHGPLMWITAILASLVAIYTAFLFAQAKGRDFWQSPTLSIHMLVHSIMAGAAVFMVWAMFKPETPELYHFLKILLGSGILVNLFTIGAEMITTHPTEDAKRTVDSILKGAYSKMFWIGIIFIGNLLPFILLFTTDIFWIPAAVGILVLIGLYFTEHVWVEAPQKMPLS